MILKIKDYGLTLKTFAHVCKYYSLTSGSVNSETTTATAQQTKNVIALADIIVFSYPMIFQIIVKKTPVTIVANAAFELNLFEKRAPRITTEKVDPIPAHAYPTTVLINFEGTT